MIETPAAAIQAEQILAEVDFVSIGTNDLAQYIFAADRHSAGLAALNEPWQPALLRMIDMVAKAAGGTGKPVGICGEAAADPLLALVLTGLGISSLSMAPGALAEVGRSIAAVSLGVCQRAARAACDAESPHTRPRRRSGDSDLDGLAGNTVSEHGEDNLIDNLDDGSIRDRWPVEEKLLTKHRLRDIEASRRNCAGMDLAALDSSPDDFLHGSMSTAAGVPAQLERAGWVGKSVAEQAT